MPSFVVKGRPKSIQSSAISRATWKGAVAAAAVPKWPTPVDHNNLRIRITFFYKALPDFDTDNISKPICDALIGVAYADDSQIGERTIRRKDINGSYQIKDVNSELATAIAAGDEFVFVEVEEIAAAEVNQI
jgi:crossover junction endodeoxyribonuclease RusA